MARKVLVRLVDDLDGLPSEGVATVTFSLDRVTYQIDLNESNASKLRDGLAAFIGAARRTGGRIKRGGAAGARTAAAANDGPMIREWAREQGHQLAERGRIPSHIVDAFRAANRGGHAKIVEVSPVRTARRAAVKTAAASRNAAAVATTATATTRGSRTRTAAPKAAPKTAPKTAAKAAPKKAAAPKAAVKAAPKTAAKAAPKTTAKAGTAKAADKTTAKATPAKKAAAKTPRATASTAASKPAARTRRAPAGRAR